MRMWMVPPSAMCRKHLLGEHVEIHMLLGSLERGRSIDGFVSRGLIEVVSMRSRHDSLAAEMEKRGYSHKSTLSSQPTDEYLRACGYDSVESAVMLGSCVDVSDSIADLSARCPHCRELLNRADYSTLHQ